MNDETLPRRLLVSLLGVDSGAARHPRPPVNTGYSVFRRAIAGLLGVRLPTQDHATVHDGPTTADDPRFDEWLTDLDREFNRSVDESWVDGRRGSGESRQNGAGTAAGHGHPNSTWFREATAAVIDAERQHTAQPGDSELRRRLAHTLLDFADEVLSQTRDGERVITSTRQLKLLADIGQRVLDLDVQGDLTKAATNLLAEVDAAVEMRWQRPGLAVAKVTFIGGAAFAAIGAVFSNVVILVCGIGIGIMFPLLAVALYRMPAWKIRALEVRPVIWKRGI